VGRTFVDGASPVVETLGRSAKRARHGHPLIDG
jgi:hypothetical protein